MYLENRKRRKKFEWNTTVFLLILSVILVFLTFMFMNIASDTALHKSCFDALTEEELWELWGKSREWMLASEISFLSAIVTIILAVIKEKVNYEND